MFKKVMIANRGEIACRIIRTCKRMGIATVAVYSEADASAMHVKLADEAVLLGPPLPAESYLSIPKLIDAAKRTRAEAVHPGYGFVSQNAHFVQACQDAGITFVGPRPEVMTRMGDKLLARQVAIDANVPILPGSHEVDETSALARAREIGFPVMVKASMGGGGIGIQRVDSEEKLANILRRARSLAKNAFGDDTIYLEKFLEGASHIEVQILGDQHGNVVHVFERDCSIQRRNQKVLEEAPSGKLSPEQREEITSHALKLARHIGYTNAGTIEFLWGQGQSYFLEMNTRLQVEHPTTEMVTGLDLVELQLRVAAGETLPFRQQDLKLTGHAVEARVYSEDSETFMPSAGLITKLREPVMPNVRVDGFLQEGYEVSPYYDPLMAKVIAWGETRSAAIQLLTNALRAYELEGIENNLAALDRILQAPAFLLAHHTTGTLTEIMAERPQQLDLTSEASQRAMAAAAGAATAVLIARAGRRPKWVTDASQHVDPWKLYGRRETAFGNTVAGRGW